MVDHLNYLAELKNVAGFVINDFQSNTIDEGASAARSCVENYSV